MSLYCDVRYDILQNGLYRKMSAKDVLREYLDKHPQYKHGIHLQQESFETEEAFRVRKKDWKLRDIEIRALLTNGGGAPDKVYVGLLPDADDPAFNPLGSFGVFAKQQQRIAPGELLMGYRGDLLTIVENEQQLENAAVEKKMDHLYAMDSDWRVDQTAAAGLDSEHIQLCVDATHLRNAGATVNDYRVAPGQDHRGRMVNIQCYHAFVDGHLVILMSNTLTLQPLEQLFLDYGEGWWQGFRRESKVQQALQESFRSGYEKGQRDCTKIKKEPAGGLSSPSSRPHQLWCNGTCEGRCH